MADYLDYLKNISSAEKNTERKLEYLRYNFGRYVRSDADVLEIGPGIGEFLALARAEGVGCVDVVDRDEAVLQFVITPN